MSASHANTHHGHDGHHGHDDHGVHVSLKGYVIGFVLSVILTAIPFWLVMDHVIAGSTATTLVILLIAAVQVAVHMVYFLHMNAKVESGWSLLALIFTVVMVAIVLIGSIWVMFHLDHNMMPGMMGDSLQDMAQKMRTMP